MITHIAIENFKGIGERVELDLRPITLLFGANSAGKSTIVHALHYAREIFERHNLDAGNTYSGGGHVDLGGFRNLVHGRDPTRKVTLGFEFKLGEVGLPGYEPAGEDNPSAIDDVLVSAQTAGVEVQLAWSELENHPLVESYSTSLDGEWVSTLSNAPGRRTQTLRVNAAHSSLSAADEAGGDIPSFASGSSAFRAIADHLYLSDVIATPGTFQGDNPDEPCETIYEFEYPAGDHPLPDFDEMLKLESRYSKDSEIDYDMFRYWKQLLDVALSQLCLGPGAALSELLGDFRYLGPLRDTPPRDFRPPRFPDTSRWASGLGAWDALQKDSGNLTYEVSDWLGSKERLNAGYTVEQRNIVELDLANPLVAKLVSGRAFDETEQGAGLGIDTGKLVRRVVIVPENQEIELRPHDVGVGISQVIPVVVSALTGKGKLTAVEQPELHLHPKLQSELGDLFIDSDGQFILETHSEHLILRLMRRIRETAEDENATPMPLTPDELAVYFVDQPETHVRVTRLSIDKSGEFTTDWPDGFFEERAKELF